VALDGAAARGLRLRGLPVAFAIIPGGRRGGLPDAALFGAGGVFLLHVAGRVFDEGPGKALAHHVGVDVAAARGADRQRAPVFVETAPVAAHRVAGDELLQAGVAGRSAWPSGAAFGLAGLPDLGRVDTLQPYAQLADADGVAIDDADTARDCIAG